ncbi:DUF5959 family protein [Streptomyces anulatus]|uniref:DUF5959 family protein n=1 Tax=Streptomyces anulatus TaxID=1892 RepID=UPI0033325C16
MVEIDDANALELFRFADPAQSVTLRVACDAPMVSGDESYYAAEIAVESGFISGTVGLHISDADLDEWSQCLDALEADEGVEWPPGDRSAWLSVVPEDPLEVTVHDSPSTQIAVQIPVDVPTGWLEENRLRLEHVRKAIAKRRPTVVGPTGHPVSDDH